MYTCAHHRIILADDICMPESLTNTESSYTYMTGMRSCQLALLSRRVPRSLVTGNTHLWNLISNRAMHCSETIYRLYFPCFIPNFHLDETILISRWDTHALDESYLWIKDTIHHMDHPLLTPFIILFHRSNARGSSRVSKAMSWESNFFRWRWRSAAR